MRTIIERNRPRPVNFDVVSNPEFLREGSAIEDTLRPDRIVVGAPSQQVAMTLLELYAPLERPMIITDVYSAEIIKYASNAFLATKISFINEIANLCELAGGDVTQVVKGMGLDPRIGAAFLNAGLGYGGSCFPKDTDALIQTAAALGYELRTLRAVVDVNRERVQRLVALIRKVLDPLDGRVIAVLGLAFKPKTDDMREARSVELITRLVEAGARVRVYDPVAMDNARRTLPAAVEYCQSSYEAAEGADAVARRDGVERVQAAEPGAAAPGDAAPARLRRAEHLRARADAPPRVRVPLDRPEAGLPGLSLARCACW